MVCCHIVYTSWGTRRCTGKQSQKKLTFHLGIPCACIAISECHSLCHPRHSICGKLNPKTYVHIGIPSYPSVKSPLLLVLLLPLLISAFSLPLSPSPLPIAPPHLPLPVARPSLPLPIAPCPSPSSICHLPLHTHLLPVHPPRLPLLDSRPLSALLPIPLPSCPPLPGSLPAPQSRHAATIIEFLLIYSSKMTFEANGT